MNFARFLYNLKMCMCFSYNPCIIFCHFFVRVELPFTDLRCINSGYLVIATSIASGPRVKLASCRSALTPAPTPPHPPPPPTHTHIHPVVYSSDRSKAVVLVLVLQFVALWFILRGNMHVFRTLCYFVLVFFSPFSIAITLRREEGANLTAFRTFVRFRFVCFLFLLVSGTGCGLWLWRFLDFSLTFFFSHKF